MRLVFAADLHLRPYIWNSRKDISYDHFRAWGLLVNHVIRTPGTVLVLGGDIFDTTTPSGLTEYVFHKGMTALKEKGHRVFFIPGNHDDEAYPRPLLFGAEALTPEPITLDGITIAGIPFTRDTEALQQTLVDIPVVDGLFMHTAFRHLLGFEEAYQCTMDDVPEHVGHVFVGHIHVANSKGKVHSPGALAVNSVAEFQQQHGYALWDTERNYVALKALPGRLFVTTSAESLEDTLNKAVANSIEGRQLPVVNVVYSKEDTPLVEGLKEKFQNKVLFLDNMRNVEQATRLDVPGATADLDLDSVIHAGLQELLGTNPAALQLATQLLSSQTPVDEMERWLHDHIKKET